MDMAYSPEQESLTRWQLDLQEELTELQYDLRGFFRNPKDGKWERMEFIVPIMNDKGVAALLNFARMFTWKSSILSDLTEAEVYATMRHAMSAVIAMLGYGKKEFGIRTEADSELILAKMEGFLFPALKRAQNGGERRFIEKTTSITVAEQGGTPTKPKNIIDSLMSLGGSGGNR